MFKSKEAVSQKQRVLNRLMKQRFVPSSDFIFKDRVHRFSQYIMELKASGCDIETHRKVVNGRNLYDYELVSQ